MENKYYLPTILLILVVISSIIIMVRDGRKYDELLKAHEKLEAQYTDLEREYSYEVEYWKNMYEQALDDLREAEGLEQYEN